MVNSIVIVELAEVLTASSAGATRAIASVAIVLKIRKPLYVRALVLVSPLIFPSAMVIVPVPDRKGVAVDVSDILVKFPTPA